MEEIGSSTTSSNTISATPLSISNSTILLRALRRKWVDECLGYTSKLTIRSIGTKVEGSKTAIY